MRIAVVPGDGIGVDVTAEAIKVLDRVCEARGIDLEAVYFPWSADHYLETGVTIPPGAFDELARGYDAIFMGAFGDPRVPDMKHAADILLGTRFGMDLYANVRPVRCLHDRRHEHRMHHNVAHAYGSAHEKLTQHSQPSCKPSYAKAVARRRDERCRSTSGLPFE